MPHGTQKLAPGETMAFYCTMDESLWARAEKIVFHDTEGRSIRCGWYEASDQ